MANRDWERFGDEIRRTVQDAIDSQNFEQLNQTITNTINNAVDGAARGVKHARDTVNQNMNYGRTYRGFHPSGRPNWNGSRWADGPCGMGEEASREWEREDRRDRGYQYQSQLPALYAKVTSPKVAGIILAALGYSLGACTLIGFIVVFLIQFLGGGFSFGLQLASVLLAVLTAAFAAMAASGTVTLGRIRRFRTYIQSMQGKEYGDIKMLAQSIGKSTKFVIKDVEKMIAKGWFRQGHLDQQKSCLITSNQAYGQYRQMVEQEALRKQEEEQQKRERKEKDIPDEVQRIIQTGDAFIQKIHRCNDAIPGEEISAKISHMEMLVKRIFERVEQNPESVADIRRLMDYYLPTTVKLLEAYEQLDMQPVQGENILSSKREIEATLDTLNRAFEKLLDDLFQDTAWDVSSDISVLRTILAQEGLTENDFESR